MARVRFVDDLVGSNADEDRIRRCEFGRDATGKNILVIMLCARVQVFAKTIALVPGNCTADREGIAEGNSDLPDQVDLVVRTISCTDLAAEFIAEAIGDVFDGATNGVAAVERALRAAQYFDARNVKDVEHRTLGTRNIDIVDIQTDARFKAPKRILLADAANETDEGGVRTTRDLQRHVRCLVLQGSDIDSALRSERIARNCGDRNRNVDQAFFSAAGGDDDFAACIGFFGGCFILRPNRSGHGRNGAKRYPRHQNCACK